LPSSDAFSPGAISSFFEICKTDSTGELLLDPLRIGARGGGFALSRGVRVHVTAKESAKCSVEVRINSKVASHAHTTQFALARLMECFSLKLKVRVDIVSEVPISAGYGTSAAGTAASCLALADAVRLPVTMNELGQLTHIAEVVNGTGLGTAAALFVGGFVLVTEPGAPGVGSLDRLLFPKEHSVICACLGPVPTPEALSATDITAHVNPPAQRAMKNIRANPELRVFLAEAKRFSQESGFLTPQTKRLMEIMVAEGAVGVAQNMIGEAVHGVAHDEKAVKIASAVRKAFPSATVFVTKLDDNGVRLESKPRPKH